MIESGRVTNRGGAEVLAWRWPRDGLVLHHFTFIDFLQTCGRSGGARSEILDDQGDMKVYGQNS